MASAEALRVLQQEYQDRYALDEDPQWVRNLLSLTPEGVFGWCHRITRLGESSTNAGELHEALVRSAGRCRRCPLFPCA